MSKHYKQVELKPNMLVMIIGSTEPNNPNIGKCGILHRVVKTGDALGNNRVVAERSNGYWLVSGEGLQTCRIADKKWLVHNQTLVDSKYLMPILPPDIEEHTEETKDTTLECKL